MEDFKFVYAYSFLSTLVNIFLMVKLSKRFCYFHFSCNDKHKPFMHLIEPQTETLPYFHIPNCRSLLVVLKTNLFQFTDGNLSHYRKPPSSSTYSYVVYEFYIVFQTIYSKYWKAGTKGWKQNRLHSFHGVHSEISGPKELIMYFYPEFFQSQDYRILTCNSGTRPVISCWVFLYKEHAGLL